MGDRAKARAARGGRTGGRAGDTETPLPWPAAGRRPGALSGPPQLRMPARGLGPGELRCSPDSRGRRWAPVRLPAQPRVPRPPTTPGRALEREAHLERGCAGSPGPRARRSPAALYPEPPAAAEPRAQGHWRGEPSPSWLRLRARRPHPPGSGPAAAAQPQRRGPLPRAARSVCFPCPTDVSQNIGHMFSGNKLGMSANTLRLRWLFQLPHGRLGRRGRCHLAAAPSPNRRVGPSPERPSELEIWDPGVLLSLAPPASPAVPRTSQLPASPAAA